MTEIPQRGSTYPYTTELLSALLRRDVYDPDYALFQDDEWYAKIERDAQFAHLIDFRCKLVAGQHWGCDPATESKEDKLAARIMGTLIKRTPRFVEVRAELAKAFLKGTTWQRMTPILEYISIPGVGRYKWRTVGLAKDVDKRRFYLRRFERMADGTERHVSGADPRGARGNSGGYKLEDRYVWRWTFSGEAFSNVGAWQPINMREWIMHRSNAQEKGLGHGIGVSAALYFLSVFKAEALARGLSFLTRWSEGMLSAAIDSLAGAATDETALARTQEWLKALEKMRSENIIVHGKGDEIKIHEGSKLGWDTVQQAIDYCDEVASRLILGSVLPTGTSQSVGSNARSDNEVDSRTLLVNFDRQLLAETLTDSLVRYLWDANRPLFRSIPGLKHANMPIFVIRQGEQHDPKERVEVAKALKELGIGEHVKVREVLDVTGYTMADEGDVTLADIAMEPSKAPSIDALEVVKAVAAGELPGESALAILALNPDISEEMARAMILPAMRKAATSPPPQAQQATPQMAMNNGVSV